MVHDNALGVQTAVARAYTIGIVASLFQVTVVIVATTNQNWFGWIAAGLWIAEVSLGTFTNRSVVFNTAQSIFGTGVSYGTRVDTLVIDAAIVLWTFLVESATGHNGGNDWRPDQIACIIRVSSISIGARASSSMGRSRAKCVYTACLDAACIDTASRVALFVRATVVVSLALGNASHLFAFAVVADDKRFRTRTHHGSVRRSVND